TTAKIRNSKAYKEYHACAMGEAAPKLKASSRKKKGDSASSTTPPTPTPTTTVESAPRLSATAKGKHPLRATTPVEPTDVQRTEAEQLKLVLKRSRHETHISQQSGSGTGEGTGSKPGVSDVQSDNSEEEISWKSSDDKDVGSHEKGNKSIQRSEEQRNLYKALVEAYEAEKAILNTYRDSTILKRRREDDDQERPSAGPNRGSKRQKEGGEQASASTPSEKATKGAGGSTTGSQSRQRSASTDDQPIVQTSQHPKWFSQPRKPPSPDRAWNTALPVAQGDAQSWISDLAKQADARSSFNELL
nr:hypothetical protein [Tanacetum cinerariifolium]